MMRSFSRDDRPVRPCSAHDQLSVLSSGACDDASLLLARFLKENGHGMFQRMSGKRGDDTHVWLEQGGFVIDITGDQFPT
ncbi:hypothetical protein ASC97_31425 [Rhizobium sp. Root1203]|nr:hypothetical protein ASC97_31425 [Rhizobium sp. Root1203]